MAPDVTMQDFASEDYIEGVSRLSCQIQLTKELDNLTVRLRDNELL